MLAETKHLTIFRGFPRHIRERQLADPLAQPPCGSPLQYLSPSLPQPKALQLPTGFICLCVRGPLSGHMEGLSSAWCCWLGPRSVSTLSWALWLSRPPPGGGSAHSRPGSAQCPGAGHVALQEPLQQQLLEGGDGTVVAAAVGTSLATLPASPCAEAAAATPRLFTRSPAAPKRTCQCLFPVTLFCDTS